MGDIERSYESMGQVQHAFKFSHSEVSSIMRKAFKPTFDQLEHFKRQGELLKSEEIKMISEAQIKILVRLAKDVEFVMAEEINKKLQTLESKTIH